MKAKLLSLLGLGTSALGVALGAAGALTEESALFQWGVVIALAGMTGLWMVMLLVLRKQEWALATIRRELNAAVDRKGDKSIQAELDDVVQELDARVLGLFEMLQRERSRPDVESR